MTEEDPYSGSDFHQYDDHESSVDIPTIYLSLDLSVNILGNVNANGYDPETKSLTWELIEADTLEEAIKQFQDIVELLKKQLEKGKTEYSIEQLQKDMKV